MAEYINALELLEMLTWAKQEVLREDISEDAKALKLYGLNFAIIAIENTLPADVQPVRHGQWELVGKIYDGKADIWKCSVCGGTVMFLTDDCPYCGAKMDGGEEDG